MSSDDDEDLKLAIAMAMSMQHATSAPPRSSTQSDIIDLTSDTENEDEDEDLRKAIALSLHKPGELKGEAVSSMESTAQHTGDKVSENSLSMLEIKNASTTTIVTPSAPPGMTGLDRKAMEEARLARLGKRKRDPSPEPPSKLVAKTTSKTEPQNPTESTSTPCVRLQEYPKGVIKRTFATKYPRTDDITIDELLQAPNVHIAVISSFMWDAEWLQQKLDPNKIKQVWIMNAKGHDVQERWIREMQDTGVPNLKLHFPPMDGMIHSMHSKFLLLFGKDKLRFAVPTANMTQIDWGEVANDWQPGVMENSVFLIDLPRRVDGAMASKSELSRFGKELVYFLEQQKVPQNVIDGLLKFDFAQTNHLAFVHSIGGSHKTENHPTGLPSLAQAVQTLRLDGIKEIELDYAASSLGVINDTLLRRIYLAACGQPFTTTTEIADVRKHIRIYFPTSETVEKSIGGRDCGGIISLTRAHHDAPSFPRECLRDYDSTRRGILSHNKLLFARGYKDDGKPVAWVYVGSANISESAWGGQRVLKNGKMGSLNIRNWECGVVMPVPDDKFAELKNAVPPMSKYDGTIEIPFRYPGTPYEGKRPWFFKPG